MNNIYYDIESLEKVFSLVSYNEKTDTAEVYYLIDRKLSLLEEQLITKEIYKDNRNFSGKVTYHCLLDLSSNIRLAQLYGMESAYIQNFKYPLVCDIDKDFDEDKHLYLCGYNSLNYDQTMLALYFADVFLDKGFQPTNPSIMRRYNDELFSSYFKPQMPLRLQYVYTFDKDEQKRFDTYKIGNMYLKYEGYKTTNPAYYIRRNQVNSGRHIDIARLNEKQSRVALKRLLGGLGCQIMEPKTDLSSKGQQKDTLNFNDLKDIIAYNTSDVVNLPTLFKHKAYSAKFQLKRQMLLDYPDLIYENDGNYKPNKNRVKYNRLTINSTSAQFATACLCPYGRLADANAVSFLYPSAKKAKERNIKQTNILQDTIKFINTRMKPLVKTPEGQEIIDTLFQMIEMYQNIENKDFNTSHEEMGNKTFDIRHFKDRINVPYMGPDGNPTDCYVTFSIGGIHGAQYNLRKYQADLSAFHGRQALFQKAFGQYQSALDMLTEIRPNGKPGKRKFITIDGKEYAVSEFVKSSSTLKRAEYKAEFTNPKKPELFPMDSASGFRKLNDKYSITSYGLSNHEDFKSYYPNLLIMLSAFENFGLGYDRYEEIFDNKEKFGKMMKDPQFEKALQEMYGVMREGTKLVLNSASGGADTESNSAIRMNNRIISMRIIGQLFAWRIGQAQSLAGAKVVSTNTDGLYTIFEESENNRILEAEAKDIGVQIDPEPIYIVSKDANNRWEGILRGKTGNSLDDIKITAASGGTLGCMDGPDPTKSLDHPAILDWGIAEFTKWKALQNRMDDYVPKQGLKLLKEIAFYIFPDKKKQMTMFQHIIASSVNTGCYNFTTKEPITEQNQFTVEPEFIQHYNRVFYVDPDKVPDDKKHLIRYLCAAYIRPEQKDAHPLAVKVIKDLHNDTEALSRGTPKLKKINGIELNTPVIIDNSDLDYTDFDINWLNFEYYNKRLESRYVNNWQNDVEHISETEENPV